MDGLVDSQTNQTAPEGGRFWIAYDRNFIYFAAKLHDGNPGSIHATEYRTNTSFPGDDYVNLLIDLRGQGADYNTFGINPRGATSITLAGGRAAKREWTGEFLAKARITVDGWELEARIPWQIMSLPRGGRKDVRFNIARFIQRTQREYDYAFTGSNQLNNAPKWLQVEIPQELVDHSIKLLPYGFAGYGKDEHEIFNGGLDLKTHLTNTTTLVGSIEPDFRNIENQILSLDFSRFARLANESRPFFQEGANYLSSVIFASQSIAKFDAGINAYGTLDDKTTFGLIETNRFGSENALAGKLIHKPDAGSDYGFAFTSRKDPGYDSSVQMVRAQISKGPYVVAARHASSEDTFAGNGASDIVAMVYNKAELFTLLNVQSTSPAYVTALGFTPEVDYKGANFTGVYDKPLKGAVSESITSLYALDYQHYHGGAYRRDLSVGQEIALKNGLDLNTNVDLPTFEGQKDHLYTAILTYPRGNPYKNLTVQYDTGSLALLPYRSTKVGISYRLRQRLQMNLSVQAVNYDGYQDQEILSFNYDLGNDRSLSGRVVKQNDKVNPYLAYRRSGNAGTEFFVILGNPNTTEFHPSLILKMTVPFEIGSKRPRLADGGGSKPA